MQLKPSRPADPIEANRQEQVHDLVRDEQSAEDGQGHRGQNLAADTAGKDHGENSDNGNPFGEKLWAQAVNSSFDDGLRRP